MTRASSLSRLSILDIDSESGSIDLFDENDGLLGSFAMQDLGDNSLQIIDINVAGVTRVDVTFSSSGAVADVKARRQDSIGVYRNIATALATVDGEIVAEDNDESGYTNPEPVVELGSIGNYVFIDYDENGFAKRG